MNIADPKYSDYVVYVDESGDHSLTSIDRNYPVFVLTFCIFRKKYYSEFVIPILRKLKFAIFGHDMVILHEHDIRKKKGAFRDFGKEKREAFFEELNILIAGMDFTLISRVIDKHELKKQNVKNIHIYHLAMEICLGQLHSFLKDQGQDDRFTHIICEARGAVEDRALELEFRRICDGVSTEYSRLPFEVVIADKKTNSEGLQIADLISRPVGLSVVRPNQSNRALKIIEKKFYKVTETEGKGYIVYP